MTSEEDERGLDFDALLDEAERGRYDLEMVDPLGWN
jgi:hypothetical protein